MSSLTLLAVVVAGSFSVSTGAVHFRQRPGQVALVERSALTIDENVSGSDAYFPLHDPQVLQLGKVDDTAINRSTSSQIVAVDGASNVTSSGGRIAALARATGKPVALQGAPRTKLNLRNAYMATAALVAVVITVIHHDKGAQVLAGILAYLFALATMKIVVKWVFAVGDFQYPVFLTGAHMLASALVGFAILAQRSLLTGKVLVVPTCRELCFKFMPLASCIAGSIGAGNSSLVFCSASFVEIVGATTPIVTVGMIFIMGLPFDLRLVGPTVVVVFGCTLSVVGEMNFSLVGFVLCFVANILRAVKVVLQSELMTGETKAKFDPCATLAWMCSCSFLVVVIWSAVSEGSAPYLRFFKAEGFHSLVCAILASCVNAVILNLAALYVTKHLGAVGGQLVAQVKAVLTVLGGMAMFHESLSAQEGVGFVFVMIGTFVYSRMEQRIKREATEAQSAKLANGGC